MMDRRVMLLAPFGLALAAGGGFYAMLRGMTAGSFDPRGIPSVLVGKRVPAFSLPGLSDTDLANGTQPVLVNFFASWCVPCVEEAPVLMALHQQGVPLIGIAYKDHAADTAAFLTRHGNPYGRMTADAPGRVAIDWGITGVPETFLIDRTGVVRWHFSGPLTTEQAEGAVTPMLRRYA